MQTLGAAKRTVLKKKKKKGREEEKKNGRRVETHLSKCGHEAKEIKRYASAYRARIV